jgi:lipopolysaccharide/colanic/teichoic acid biosynthesis glycosyltransferase
MDLILTALLLPLLLIPITVIGVMVFLDSPGPVIYGSPRVGFHGRRFRMWKFRSMRDDVSGPSLAGGGDNRVTRLGRLLRATRLDELPQLWNVVSGEMSWVGPRPELAEFVDRYANDYERILEVPPGITGATQLKFAAVEANLLSGQDDPAVYYADHLLPNKVVIDLEYARTRTTLGDLRLLLATLGVVPTLLVQRLRSIAAVRRLKFATYAFGVGLSTALLLAFVVASGSPR